MRIKFEDFLRTGNFGLIQLGMSKDDVISIIGKPDGFTDLGETGIIVLYGWYEFFFDHELKLHSIQNDNYSPYKKNTYAYKNASFEIDSWFFNEVINQNIKIISDLLEEKNISYNIVNYYGHDAIKLKSGVIVDFAESANKNGILELIGFRLWP